MALNLVRNSRVFFTTNVDANTGVINNTGYTPANTFEIQVLDGLTFSQNTGNEQVSVSEAGGSPVRGTRTFNTTLEPASFSFSTYLRPDLLSSTPWSEECVLWNAFTGAESLFGTGVAIGAITGGTYTGSTGRVALTGTALTNLANFEPNMICYLPSPFSAITIGGGVATAPQLASMSGLVRVISITGATNITFEYLNKPFAGDGSAITANATLTVLPPNAVVPLGVTASSYTATTNTFTLTGTITNSGSFPVGSYFVFKGLAGTSGATFNNQPAQVTASSSESISFVFATAAVDSAERLTATITTTDLFCLKTSWVPSTGTGTNSFVSFMNSNKNQLIKSGYIFLVDQVAYALDNAVLTEVSIDFGIDAIATAAWSGQATGLRQLSTSLGATSLSACAGTFTGTINGVATVVNAQLYTPKNTAADFLTNKLSTCVLTVNKALLKSDGTTAASAASTYTVPLTGGSITLTNNVTYLTPSVLAVVNQPINYFTGNRGITGSMSAYLKTGTTNATGNLLNDMLSAAASTVEPFFGISLAINGSGQSNRVVLDLPNATIGLPAVDVQQVVSTTINFAAQGTTGTTSANTVYDIEGINDIYIRYFAA